MKEQDEIDFLRSKIRDLQVENAGLKIRLELAYTALRYYAGAEHISCSTTEAHSTIAGADGRAYAIEDGERARILLEKCGVLPKTEEAVVF